MTRLLAASMAVLAMSCDTAPEPAQREPPAVTVATSEVIRRHSPERIIVGGTVQPRTTALVSSRMVAPIVSVAVAPGDRVKTGQILVVLDSRDLAAQARRAAAGASAEEHALRAAQADRDAAQSAVTLAGASHERVVALHARRSATAQELDEAVGALRAAEARQVAAAARLAGATAALESAREGTASAAAAAAFATIRAPFDGIVAERLADPGDLAAPGAPLLRLEDTRNRQLEVRVDESLAAAIDGPVEVALDAAAGGDPAWIPARVVETSRLIEAGSHSFLVKIELPASAARSGTFARARFTGATRSVLAVPRTAVVYQGQLPTIFVVSAGTARMRVVRIGTAGDEIEIAAGVAAGETVITNPPASLRDGDRVETRPAAAAGAP